MNRLKSEWPKPKYLFKRLKSKVLQSNFVKNLYVFSV